MRLEGPVYNLLIVAVCLPHKGRVCPTMSDTLKELDMICKQAKPGECIVVMGDLNVQLPVNEQGYTGKHVCAQGESPESTEVLNFMWP